MIQKIFLKLVPVVISFAVGKVLKELDKDNKKDIFGVDIYFDED
ncbi:hypothetical protein [Brachyspira intermedia]